LEKKIFPEKKEEKAQVSFDYLIMLTFIIGLAMVVTSLVTTVEGVAQKFQGELLQFRDDFIGSLIK